jgi:nanoRNase/pAp phosphatase (c-di-AMP/oligoRNAs hydrolase)
MTLNLNQQIWEQIGRSRYILIAFAKGNHGDSLATSLALGIWLKKMGKKFDIVSSGFVLPPKYTFLPDNNLVQNKLINLRKFIITLDISKTKLKEFSYDIKGDDLEIYITPNEGNFSDEDLKSYTSNYRYDLIITIGSADLESLGDTYNKNTDFFYRIPVINIDHRPENEHFGKINLVDITKSSTAELVFNLIDQLDPQTLDEQISTCLLTGMITSTKSFKTANVTPQTLAIASRLIVAGGQREEIIRHLYQTKTIILLKLWGEVLTRLQTDPQSGIVWSFIEKKDFVKLRIKEPVDFTEIIHELISYTPEAGIVVLFYEDPTSDALTETQAIIYTNPHFNALELAKRWQPIGSTNLIRLNINKNLNEAQEEVLSGLNDKLHKLNIRS